MATVASRTLVAGGAGRRHGAGRFFKPRFEDWPVVWLWPLGLVFMQTALIRFDSFDVTLAVLVVHALQIILLVRYWVRKPSRDQILVYLGALAYALLLGLASADPIEFLRSMAQIANLVLMVAICMNLRLERRREVGRSIRVFCVLASLTAVVVIVQSIAFNVVGDVSFSRLLGPYTAPTGPGAGAYVPQELSAVKKANGWFSEPSVAAWFLVFAAAVALAARRLSPRLAATCAILCLAGAVATLSLTGLLATIGLVAAYLLFVRDSLRFKLFWAAAGGIGVGAALLLAGDLGMQQRVEEIDSPGTSIYFRFTAPAQLVVDSITSFPFGYPPGQTEIMADKPYYQNWSGGSQTNVDNMLFMIVLHFGVLGIAFQVGYFAGLLRALVQYRRPAGLIMLGVTFSMLATGAGWAHHSVLVVGYAILAGRYVRRRRRRSTPRPLELRRAPLLPQRPLTPPRKAAPPPVEMPRAGPLRVASPT